MKRRAVFGQWKTPPHVLYPSGGAGMKKSTSMPVFSTNPNEARGNAVVQQQRQTMEDDDMPNKRQQHDSSPIDSGMRRVVSFQQAPPGGSWPNSPSDLSSQHSVSSTGKRNAEGVRRAGYPNSSPRAMDRASPVPQGVSSPVGSDRNEHEKRNKRLARNRASARMRRLRKKTVVETLERECEYLESSIAMLKNLEDQKNAWRNSQHDSDNFILLSQTPGMPITPEEQQTILLHMFGGEDEAHSISMARRRAAFQLYIDRQIAMALAIQKRASLNTMLANLALDSPATPAAAAQRLEAKQRFRQGVVRALSYRVASHLPVTEQEFAERPRKSPGSSVMTSANAVLRVPVSSPGGVAELALVSVNGQPPHGLRVATGVDLQEVSQGPEPNLEAVVSETDKLKAELAQVLNLNNAQQQRLRDMATGVCQERLRVQAMAKAAVAMASHDWFEFPCTESMMSQFRGVLTAPQMVKFLGWSERNLMAIRALPIVTEKPVPQDSAYKRPPPLADSGPLPHGLTPPQNMGPFAPPQQHHMTKAPPSEGSPLPSSGSKSGGSGRSSIPMTATSR